ncbi:MAG: 2-iminobutanoate/2-iminopropanoate deaminase [Sphingobacteriales bacterium]|jgi:2-iminobutanoate/2-iminopropanoate deaminase
MKEIIYTKNAPAPIGPYSQGVKAGGMIYLSGQIALNPETGKLEIDNISDETHLVMKNIKALLNEAGADFNNVVKCSIFLSDMGNFGAVNEVYAQYFGEKPPARECVQVSVLPKNVNVEISVIALDN